jgi:hypothetical protein
MSDWTVGRDGCSNTSDAFEIAVLVVSSVLREHRLGGDVPSTARLIMAQLAHNYGFGPLPPPCPKGFQHVCANCGQKFG